MKTRQFFQIVPDPEIPLLLTTGDDFLHIHFHIINAVFFKLAEVFLHPGGKLVYILRIDLLKIHILRPP